MSSSVKNVSTEREYALDLMGREQVRRCSKESTLRKEIV
jgi:hypothetical protein